MKKQFGKTLTELRNKIDTHISDFVKLAADSSEEEGPAGTEHHLTMLRLQAEVSVLKTKVASQTQRIDNLVRSAGSGTSTSGGGGAVPSDVASQLATINDQIIVIKGNLSCKT